MSLGNWKAFNLVDVGLINFDMMVNLWCPRKLKQATASRGMLSTRTARRAHMTELTRVGLTCRAFARAGSKGGSHDRAHTGAGSHAGHSFPSLFPVMETQCRVCGEYGCTKARHHKCSKCGISGHNYKTCPQSDTDSDEGGTIVPVAPLPLRRDSTKSLTQVSFLDCWLCDIDNIGKMK